MSLHVNAVGKIIVSGSLKPIECLNCPCDPIVGDPWVYCVTKEFYSGGCPGGTLIQTLEHQCLCVDSYCTSGWDKVSFCDGNVRYIYESGPHFLGCPDDCNPVTGCPTACASCSNTYSLTIDTYDGFCCCDQPALLISNSPFTLTRFGGATACSWSTGGWVALSAILEVSITLTCDVDYGWKVFMTFRADFGEGWVDPFCDDAATIGFSSCPVGNYTFVWGTGSVI